MGENIPEYVYCCFLMSDVQHSADVYRHRESTQTAQLQKAICPDRHHYCQCGGIYHAAWYYLRLPCKGRYQPLHTRVLASVAVKSVHSNTAESQCRHPYKYLMRQSRVVMVARRAVAGCCSCGMQRGWMEIYLSLRLSLLSHVRPFHRQSSPPTHPSPNKTLTT